LHRYRYDGILGGVITTFADKATRDIYDGANTRDARGIPQQLWPSARRKLDMLNAAYELRDLASPPGNRLEALRGDLSGYHSIRINDQFRVVFRFVGGKAEEVKITDYH
jgi:toxin HigB-1